MNESQHIVWTTLAAKPDYANKNSYLIYGMNTPTTIPYNPSTIPDVHDIAITKDLVTPVSLNTCSAPSLDHVPVLIDTWCRSSFLSPPERLDFRRTDWSKFQACLEAELPSNPDLLNEMAIDACVKELSSLILKVLTDSTPMCRPHDDPQPPLTAHTQDEIRLKNLLRRQWQITRDPALKA